jgi:hypothetical protein
MSLSQSTRIVAVRMQLQTHKNDGHDMRALQHYSNTPYGIELSTFKLVLGGSIALKGPKYLCEP